ncbi:MAG: M20/M25/M40 family metallo-hydrolase [Chloroflexota bacterium]|nr:M20/M25/M40 family metallo-hydrolase [Chloroflexota bacterium]
MSASGDAVGETTELLQQLIRNRCVNEGSEGSGHEARSAETLASYLAAPGAEMRRYEPVPGRTSLVLRVEGRDRKAPTLCLMGHTDVVPAEAEGWSHDPFGGEVVDGEVWGRGAIDMLGITASMAVATKRMMRSGWRPRGTFIYFAVADEEAMGTYGAEWMVNEHWDAVGCDLLVTEFGGTRLPLGSGVVLPIAAAEKGSHWTRLRASGVPGHGSMPYRTENAVVSIGEVIARIGRYRPPADLHPLWCAFVASLGVDGAERAELEDPRRLERRLEAMPLGIARTLHALTHTTFSPNIVRGGNKVNVVAESAQVDVDIRTLPEQDGESVRAMLREALGDLWPRLDIAAEGDNVATASPAQGALWDALARATMRLVPGSRVVPFMVMGATDARFFRRKGTTAYGYGLFSERVAFDEFMQMFHGRNERIDQASLGLMVELWESAAREVLA